MELKQKRRAGDILAALIAKHNVRAIAIGNGTASRETDECVKSAICDSTFHALR